MVFYRKYRPKTFSEVVGQEHVVQTLRGALQSNNLAHAYLFTGPRGTGKTTMARLLAKAVNCEKNVLRSEGDEILSRTLRSDACGVCSFCKEIEDNRSLDLVEIDAASNRGIDEIRALREGARFSSMASGKHKVYIIDECHMLTKEASNAFLKTLEEPAAKTLFVLATTEPSKILPTIISRVQRFDFKKLNSQQIVYKLEKISLAEKIKIDKKLLQLIALQAEGSLRDAESNLSKLVAFKGREIDEEAVKEILGFIPLNTFNDFMNLIVAKKKSEAILLVNQLYESGLDLDNFVRGLLGYVRKILVIRASAASNSNFQHDLGSEHFQVVSKLAASLESKDVLKLLTTLMRVQQEMKITPIPQLPLEIAISELTEMA